MLFGVAGIHRTILLVARQAPAHEGREAETASAGFPSEKVGLSIARELPPPVRIHHTPGKGIVNRFAYTPNIAAHGRCVPVYLLLL